MCTSAGTHELKDRIRAGKRWRSSAIFDVGTLIFGFPASWMMSATATGTTRVVVLDTEFQQVKTIRVIGWAVGLWLFLVPGFVCGEAASPTPVASLATANPTPEGKISLEATARKRVPNKVADVVLAVQVDGRTGDAVSSALSQRSQMLLDYLRQQAVDRLTTEEVGFEPQVEPVRGGPDRIVGYTGHASVSFRTTPDKLGTVLSGSLEHGANTITQTQFRPLESDIDAARRDLAIEATKTALARADAIAQAAGVRVVRIEDITVRSEESAVPLQFKSARAMEAPAPARAIETATGEQEVSVRVLVQVGTCK
jgi:uncharacterized protein YggE